jgi:hypothetical protein
VGELADGVPLPLGAKATISATITARATQHHVKSLRPLRARLVLRRPWPAVRLLLAGRSPLGADALLAYGSHQSGRSRSWAKRRPSDVRPYASAMDLMDATRIFLVESAAQPEVMRIAQSIHDQLQFGQQVSHTQLSDMLGKASEKGLFAPIVQKYGEATWNDMIMVIGREIDWQRPVPARPRWRQ